MKLFRVAPDGTLLDQVAEFAFGRQDQLRTFFAGSAEGYVDSIAKMVQTLASSERIASDNRPAVTSVTGILKEHLQEAGRLEFSEFFRPHRRAEHQNAAATWLTENWPLICADLEDPESSAESALIGHFHREFHYFWLHVDPAWNASWYLPERAALNLPRPVMQRVLHAMNRLVQQYALEISEDQMRAWINRVATTHFKVFGEYWLHLGEETGDEYMPAFTRSSLQFLKQPSCHGSIERLAMPFVGLAALARVKQRGDLVERVVEWSEGSGKEIVQGLQRLQEITRTVRSEEERKRLLDEVEDVLTSKLSRGFRIALNLIRVVTAAFRGEADVDAAETAVRLNVSSSYRWLWRIREPELQWAWRHRLEKLLE